MPKVPRKLTRSTQGQINLLVEYMATHPNFANGEFKSPMGSRSSSEEWVKLKELLDNYGPEKSVEQWKLTWRDLKKKAREENARSTRAVCRTGNNTDIPKISENSLKILGAIGFECSTGCGSMESPIGTMSLHPVEPVLHAVLPSYPVTETFIPSTSTSSISCTPSITNPILPTIQIEHNYPVPHQPPVPDLTIATSPSPQNVPPLFTNENIQQLHTDENIPPPQPNPDASARRTRSSGAVVHDFILLQRETNDLQRSTNYFLEDISKSLKERNILLHEQNEILKEQNNILKMQRFGDNFRRRSQ